ncbi:DUF3618 domain-containing protein [Actinomadura napierensis]|uniref:DUF3618 domain-containing protein n=1 Tax=Actinomadura napierensis TaxID=267854 RepID=A0ABN3AID5_9ACTN
MTTQGRHGSAAGTEELRQEVDRARQELGETVEALAAKADVKAMAREKAEYARDMARDRAQLVRRAATSPQARTRAVQGGAAVATAGAVAALTVWMRRRRTPQARLRRRLRNAPVQVRVRRTQRAPIRMRRTGRGPLGR